MGSIELNWGYGGIVIVGRRLRLFQPMVLSRKFWGYMRLYGFINSHAKIISTFAICDFNDYDQTHLFTAEFGDSDVLEN